MNSGLFCRMASLAVVLTVFSLLVGFPVQPSAGHLVQEFEQRAIRSWSEKQFMDYFVNHNNPTEAMEKDGIAEYNELKDAAFSEVGASWVVLDVPGDAMKKFINMKQQKSLISESERDEQLSLLESSSRFKTIRESVVGLGNAEFVYDLTGLLKLGDNLFSDFTSSRKFKLNLTPTPTISSSLESDGKLWGIIRERKWTLWKNEEEASDFTNSINYLRSQSLKDFVEKSAAYSQFLNKNAETYKRFLPNSVVSALKALADNPEKRPDEVLNEDPLKWRTRIRPVPHTLL